MHEPLLWNHLPFGTDGFARDADPRTLDDLGASGEQAGSRASERVVAEAVDLRPTAGRRAASAVAEGEWHAQASAERELHGLGRKRRGWLGWYGSEPGPCMRPDWDRTSARASGSIAGSIILSRKCWLRVRDA